MEQDSANGSSQTGGWWNELTILKGVLLVAAILFLVLAFCPH